jgi:hypothetical protein
MSSILSVGSSSSSASSSSSSSSSSSAAAAAAAGLSPMDKVEILIGLVARAFYPDDMVIILDYLTLREKFVLKTEIAPRLKMDLNKCEKAYEFLLESRMLSVEVVPIPETTVDGKEVLIKREFLYIDYLWFVHYVNLRIETMISKAESVENNKFHNCKKYYKCPTCGMAYTHTEVFSNRNNENNFLCATCCPVRPLKVAPSDPRYVLKNVENRDYNTTSKLTQEKIKGQLKTSVYCGGVTTNILDLLRDLEREPLSRNYPSNNLKVGHGNTK